VHRRTLLLPTRHCQRSQQRQQQHRARLRSSSRCARRSNGLSRQIRLRTGAHGHEERLCDRTVTYCAYSGGYPERSLQAALARLAPVQRAAPISRGCVAWRAVVRLLCVCSQRTARHAALALVSELAERNAERMRPRLAQVRMLYALRVLTVVRQVVHLVCLCFDHARAFIVEHARRLLFVLLDVFVLQPADAQQRRRHRRNQACRNVQDRVTRCDSEHERIERVMTMPTTTTVTTTRSQCVLWQQRSACATCCCRALLTYVVCVGVCVTLTSAVAQGRGLWAFEDCRLDRAGAFAHPDHRHVDAHRQHRAAVRAAGGGARHIAGDSTRAHAATPRCQRGRDRARVVPHAVDARGRTDDVGCARQC
jgi:hypothetical protein